MNPFTPIQGASATDLLCILSSAALAMVSMVCTIMAGTTQRVMVILQATLAMLFDAALFHGVFDAVSATVAHREPISPIAKMIHSLSPHDEIVLIMLLLAIALFRLLRMTYMMKRNITRFSLGEALDDLPLGILFAGENGQVLQANRTMEELNRRLGEGALFDGKRFWENIRLGRLPEGNLSKGGDTPIITTENGETWIFSRQHLPSKIKPFYQILAINATKEEEISEETRQNVNKLVRMNRRLKEYNYIVDDTIRKEELLEAKKRVHDNMGTTLLSVKVLAGNRQGPLTPAQIMEQWREDLELLREESRQGEQVDPLQRFREAANFLGIELIVTGELPASHEAADLIATGIQECMTNAVQHAQATEMYVDIERGDEEYTVIYSNNGKELDQPIREGTGLSLLRNHAEKVGATIEYRDGRQFCMILHIPNLR